MSLITHVSIKSRTFRYLGYSVVVQELYMDYADTPGSPSYFVVFYAHPSKENILSIAAQVGFKNLNEDEARFLSSNGINVFMIQNGGFFRKHNIDWGVEEAKKKLSELYN